MKLRTTIKAALLAVATAALVTSCFDPREIDFRNECASLGGEVQWTDPPGFFVGGRIDCIVGNEIIYLKGYN